MRRGTYLLVGIGLVLVGLLSGILFMLVWESGDAQSSPQVVERVELGKAAATDATSGSEMSELADTLLPEPTQQTALLNNRFKEVANRVTPSVVYLEVELGDNQNGDVEEYDGRAPEDFFRGPRRSVGSGVIVSSSGHIVTNHHVIDGASTILVTLSDRRQYEAEVVGSDETTDLAVLQVEGRNLPVMSFGNSDDVEVGEWVIAIGNPFRLTSTVTAGIVGALGRQVNIIRDDFGIESFIQTDAAISPGNSGGALVNLDGELVGINTAIASRSGSYEGYGFAVPVNLMERVVSDLIEYGRVNRGYLGVSIQEIDARQAREMGMDHVGGVLIAEAQRGGSAHSAGIRSGDVVISVEGRRVNAPNELQSVVALKRPGDEVELEIWRDGNTRTYEIELAGRDDDWFSDMMQEEEERQREQQERDLEPESQLYELGAWGMGVRPISESEAETFGTQRGAYLAYVASGSVADQGGVPRGVVITHVDDERVSSVEALVETFDAAEDVILLQVRQPNGVSAFYEVQVP